MSRITKMAVQVECDGKPYAVNLDQAQVQLAAHMLGCFCKDGVLQLVALPEGCAFDKLANILKKETI